jgi:hypothetical protein
MQSKEFAAKGLLLCTVFSAISRFIVAIIRAHQKIDMAAAIMMLVVMIPLSNV